MSGFVTDRQLGFGHCDLSGIAYFPRYIEMLAAVVEELFATIGCPYRSLIGERHIGTPTVQLDVTFSKPGVLGDVLQWRVEVCRIGTSSIELIHRVSAHSQQLWQARQVIVATSTLTHKSIHWPDDIRAGLSKLMEKSHA